MPLVSPHVLGRNVTFCRSVHYTRQTSIRALSNRYVACSKAGMYERNIGGASFVFETRIHHKASYCTFPRLKNCMLSYTMQVIHILRTSTWRILRAQHERPSPAGSRSSAKIPMKLTRVSRFSIRLGGIGRIAFERSSKRILPAAENHNKAFCVPFVKLTITISEGETPFRSPRLSHTVTLLTRHRGA